MSWSCLHSQIHSPSKAFILHLIQSSDQSIFSLPSHFWPHLIHFFTHRIITISSMSWSHTESMSFLHGTVYLICSILILFDCFISSGWFLSLSSYWIEKTELLQLHFRETHSMYFFRPKRNDQQPCHTQFCTNSSVWFFRNLGIPKKITSFSGQCRNVETLIFIQTKTYWGSSRF